jgi:DNA polymerase-1
MNLLLVDFNNLFYKALNANMTLTSDLNDIPIGGAYGFIKQLCETVNAVRPERLIALVDSRPYEREKIYHEYKARRSKNNTPERIEIISYNKALLDKVLKSLHLPVIAVKGLEADDLIAIAINQYKKEFDKIIIDSTDSDLIQLLRDRRVCLRRKYKGKVVNYDRERFLEEFDGLTTTQFVKYLAMVGTHNAVPGIRGIGKTTAPAIVRDDARYDKLYKEHKTELDLYIKLIKLPYHDDVTLPEKLSRCSYNEREMIRILSKDGIDIQKHMHDAFEFIGG